MNRLRCALIFVSLLAAQSVNAPPATLYGMRTEPQSTQSAQSRKNQVTTLCDLCDLCGQVLARPSSWCAAHIAQTGRLVKPPAALAADEAASQVQFNGVITGRVLSEDGFPIAGAQVRATATGGEFSFSSGPLITDDDGYFRVASLLPSTYAIEVAAAGYIQAPADEPERSARRHYRPGDHATITLLKGGVITGRVTDTSGGPVVAVRVRAVPARAAHIRELDHTQPRYPRPGHERLTDERGIYRLFGLEPGSYLVVANSHQWESSAPALSYGEDAPTYFPSATPAAAQPVTVQGGEEVSGIDIRYRGESGHAISGRIVDPAGSGDPARDKVAIALSHAASGVIEALIPHYQWRSESSVFVFPNIPDGEYELTARRAVNINTGAASPPRRVSVKGADVTGIELKLAPLGLITGRVILEASQEADRQPACASQRRSLPEEIAITAHREEQSYRTGLSSAPIPVIVRAPNERGDFTLPHLEAGRYRVLARLSGEAWYVRAITLSETTRAKPPVDAARDGLALKAGERLTGLTVTLAEGTAGLSGQVKPATEGARLPARLRVHLVPTERESADDLLRYGQANARSDGTFAFTNLAPGRYWLLARPIPDDESSDSPARPAAWDNNERVKLRREAEAAKVAVELRPCQRTSDFALRFTSPTPGK